MDISIIVDVAILCPWDVCANNRIPTPEDGDGVGGFRENVNGIWGYFLLSSDLIDDSSALTTYKYYQQKNFKKKSGCKQGARYISIFLSSSPNTPGKRNNFTSLN